MITDGERIKALLIGANKRILICAPFIKKRVLKTVLEVVSASVPVQIFTRWRANEVAVGVSDLEVFYVAKERPKTDLYILDNLHAKLYLADDQCLVGSANLTSSALGWSDRSNIELLIEADSNNDYVATLLEQLKFANPATIEQLTEIESELVNFEFTALDEGQDMTDEIEYRKLAWLPSCATPEKLWDIYSNPLTTIVTEDTRQDGNADLRDLQIQQGLTKPEFIIAVQKSLSLMPAFNRITEEIPVGVRDTRGNEIIANYRPELSKQVQLKQWEIVRGWIGFFFQDQFEVAAESFIVRLKSNQ